MATAVLGSLAPTTELEGTVYYKEVSHVATEVNGKVNDVLFEEGQHLDARAPMVRLDYALLAMQLAAARAQHEQAQTQLAQERVRLERAVALLESGAFPVDRLISAEFPFEKAGEAMEQWNANPGAVSRMMISLD